MTAMLDFFKRKSPSLIGVDIASTSLKLVELSEVSNGVYRVQFQSVLNAANWTDLAGDITARAGARVRHEHDTFVAGGEEPPPGGVLHEARRADDDGAVVGIEQCDSAGGCECLGDGVHEAHAPHRAREGPAVGVSLPATAVIHFENTFPSMDWLC